MTSTREKPLILVVDDEADIRHMVTAHLSQMKCDLIEAPDGDTALAMILEHRPDLVLLDVRMPGLNGWEVAKYIREREEFNNMGLIIVTGIGESLNEMTAPVFGADEHINKPFRFAELDVKIRKTLARRRAPHKENAPTPA